MIFVSTLQYALDIVVMLIFYQCTQIIFFIPIPNNPPSILPALPPSISIFSLPLFLLQKRRDEDRNRVRDGERDRVKDGGRDQGRCRGIDRGMEGLAEVGIVLGQSRGWSEG